MGESAAVALNAATRVASAASAAGVHGGEIVCILEQLVEMPRPCSDEQHGMPTPSETSLEESVKEASEAVATANHAAAECRKTADEASLILRKSRIASLSKFAEGPAPCLRSLLQAVRPLGEAAREAAVAAMEVADACTQAFADASSMFQRKSASQEATAPDEKADDESSASNVENNGGDSKQANVEEKQEDSTQSAEASGEIKQEDVKKVVENMEARRACSAWLDIHRTARRAAKELDGLLLQARALQRRDASVIPGVPDNQRARLLALAAEFLDVSAVQF